MNVLSIIPAPNKKKVWFYDPIKKTVRSEIADILGVVEFFDPDGSDISVTMPCYLCYDEAGFYAVPSMAPNFIDILDVDTVFDLGDYKERIELITMLYKEMDEDLMSVETVQVKHEGKVSFIKRQIKKPSKPEGDKD